MLSELLSSFHGFCCKYVIEEKSNVVGVLWVLFVGSVANLS